MEPDTRYTVIGAVVLALIAAAVAGFLWLSSSGRSSDFRYYTVYFEHQSLEGLQVGGNVNMRGITVGRVEDYTLGLSDVNRVKVTLRLSRSAPVRESTKASVARNVLTGIARINLDTPNAQSPELVAVPAGEQYPVIAEGTSNLDQIADSVSHLASVANTTLENVNAVLGPENQKVFREVLTGIRDLSNNMNARLAKLEKTNVAIDNTAVAFQQASRDIALSAKRLVDGIEPTSREAAVTLREAQATLRTFSADMRALEQELSTAIRRFEKNGADFVRSTDNALDTSVHELRVTATELRSSAEVVSRALSRLQDPKAALFGPSPQQLGPGEAQP
jgi:phospholipid/cholesterol/gamma-HCH transport system substrate-binding protein